MACGGCAKRAKEREAQRTAAAKERAAARAQRQADEDARRARMTQAR